MRATKAICFRCKFIGIGLDSTRCPVCDYPLIVNTASAALGASDLERFFARKVEAPPLPGVSAEKRKAQLLMEKRQARWAKLAEEKRLAEAAEAERRARGARRRLVRELFAASCFVAGLLVTLNVLGAF